MADKQLEETAPDQFDWESGASVLDNAQCVSDAGKWRECSVIGGENPWIRPDQHRASHNQTEDHISHDSSPFPEPLETSENGFARAGGSFGSVFSSPWTRLESFDAVEKEAGLGSSQYRQLDMECVRGKKSRRSLRRSSESDVARAKVSHQMQHQVLRPSKRESVPDTSRIDDSERLQSGHRASNCEGLCSYQQGKESRTNSSHCEPEPIHVAHSKISTEASTTDETDWQIFSNMLNDEETRPASSFNYTKVPSFHSNQFRGKHNAGTSFIPLRQWVDATSGHHRSAEQAGEQKRSLQNETLMQKITIAYGIARILQHAKEKILSMESKPSPVATMNPENPLERIFSLDNFEVGISSSTRGFGKVDGLEMIMPAASIYITTHDQSDYPRDCNVDKKLGRIIQIHFVDGAPTNNEGDQSDEEHLCFLFGCLMYELFAKKSPIHNDDASSARGSTDQLMCKACSEEPSKKKSFSELLSVETGANERKPSSRLDITISSNGISSRRSLEMPDDSVKFVPLHHLGFPSSLSFLVQSLLDCGWDDFRPDNSYPSLQQAISDLRLLLKNPESYLYDSRFSSSSFNKRKLFQTKQNKLYGREKEVSYILNEFYCHQMRGESRVLFIDGYSGSGKSALVRSSFKHIDVAGGYILKQKFSEVQDSPISVVVSAFDSLCPLLRDKCSPLELEEIVSELVNFFGSELNSLARLLPSLRALSPDLIPSSHVNNELNLSSIYFSLQHFVRILCFQKSIRIVLFLDDLQWADATALDLVWTILSDFKGSSVLFFISSYRTNEIGPSHALHQFIGKLDSCNVPHSKLHVNGMDEEALNSMISDSLCVFPRLCRSLSNLVLRKTKGNPLFSLEFLQSLVDREVLRFSLRENRWVWDEEVISAIDISNNVCDLLLVKMSSLPQSTQEALKIASCFGNKISSTLAMYLSSTPQYSSFQSDLEEAEMNGYMEKIGTDFCFVHDKVREAAHNLIGGSKNQFRFNLGMLLYDTIPVREITAEGSTLIAIVDQINQGDVNWFTCKQEIAELNFKAGKSVMMHSNFTGARSYLFIASKLLPDTSWQRHYTLTLNTYLMLGNAFYACGDTQDAMATLDTIILKGSCLEDKLEAYSLLITLLTAQQPSKAYATCIDVLTKLGEEVPDKPGNILEKTKESMGRFSSEEIIGMKESKSHLSLMKIYTQAGFASYFVSPKMTLWFSCKLVELSLVHGMCKYSAIGIAQYGNVLGSKLVNDIEGGYKMGRISLALLKRFDAMDQVPVVYLHYYSYLGLHYEPLQSSAHMLNRAFELSTSIGDTSTAFIIGIQYTQKAFVSGVNLLELKSWSDNLLRLMDNYSHSTWKSYMLLLRETICTVIDNDGSSIPESNSGNVEFDESAAFHRATRSFWLGHYERCNFITEKIAVSDVGKLKSVLTFFYQGISALHMIKVKKKACYQEIAMDSIETFKSLSKTSSWNYSNKQRIIEALLLSSQGEKNKADDAFKSAIALSCASKFIHEQGLACELAGLYYKRNGHMENALRLLIQAKECYSQWGSQMKMKSINRIIYDIHQDN